MILGLRPNGAAPRYRSGGGRPPAIERGTLRAGISDNTAALARRHRNHTCILARQSSVAPSFARGRYPGTRTGSGSGSTIWTIIFTASEGRAIPDRVRSGNGRWTCALGLLRPPWALAHHQLFEASFAD